MPAPNIATLYDFESVYEDALKNYFANLNVGGQTFTQVVTPRSNLAAADFLVTPRLQVRASMTGLGADGGGVKQDSAPNVPGGYYSHYQMQVAMDVITSRSNTSQSHGLLRGAVRQGMLEVSSILNNTTVPYYQTPFVNPLGSLQAVDMENDEIQTQMTWQLDVYIPPTSLP